VQTKYTRDPIFSTIGVIFQYICISYHTDTQFIVIHRVNYTIRFSVWHWRSSLAMINSGLCAVSWEGSVMLLEADVSTVVLVYHTNTRLCSTVECGLLGWELGICTRVQISLFYRSTGFVDTRTKLDALQ